jgi:NAD(P)H-nitrite reductase large subunit
MQTTVVEIAPRMVARMLNGTAGGMLGRWCEARGVHVLTGLRVERIARSDDGGADTQRGGFLAAVRAALGSGGSRREVAQIEPGLLSVVLSDGRKVEAKLVVLAMGVQPNIGMLQGSGIATDRRICVDDFLRPMSLKCTPQAIAPRAPISPPAGRPRDPAHRR